MSKKVNLFDDPRMGQQEEAKNGDFRRFRAKNIVGQMGV
jgi:hypothetical protein